MNNKVNEKPEWAIRGKTIKQLIKELQTFENQDLEVMMSTDGGETFKRISLVGKHNDNGTTICVLENYE